MILGTVNLRLTRMQTAALQKLWDECAEGKGIACIVAGKVTLKIGRFFIQPATAEFAILESHPSEPIQPGIAPAKGGTA